tara:strand:- start:2855 stop:4822 length:1968 start_codon:yes stop_codon:yes gene_type:complete
MSTKKKLLQAAAGAASGAGLDVDEVFSTYLYTGNGTDDRAINNGIDLSGEGGMVWIKNRDFAFDHLIGDTERGITKGIRPNNTVPENNFSDRIKTVTSTGFTIGTADEINSSNTGYTGSLMKYCSWTFRKAPKFFDIVTWTGDGTTNRAISHNLGSTPGCIIIKRTSLADGWYVHHRYDYTKYGFLSSTNAFQSTNSGTYFGSTAPNNTHFYLGQGGNGNNASGQTYVAYLFAHNNSDGEFGPDADQDIIKCGSYTGNGSTDGTEVNLGFEPQWLLIKDTTSTGSWYLLDVMRGIVTDGNDSELYANQSNAEATVRELINLTPTGFKLKISNIINTNNNLYIYMAIRRGPLAEPESATDVFAIDQRGGTSPTPPMFNSGFVTDFAIWFNTATNPKEMNYRLSQNVTLDVNATSAEHSQSNRSFDYMNGWGDFTSSNTSQYAWMWKRAPSFCDVVTYTGTGSAATINHNLGVAPEMMWVKCRSSGGDWIVYHTGSDSTNPSHKYLELNDTATVKDTAVMWNDTEPTSSVFSIGTNSDVNASGATYVAFLFATVAGVSKVGSYTGTGTAGLNVDCGFSSGARFVLIKKATGTASYWAVFDSTRGIVAGNDPFLRLNDTTAETTSIDAIDPYSAGFTVATDFSFLNNSGDTYIFYAIA